jgi:hypothetical protein
MNDYLIPLTNAPQTFSITLAGVTYTMTNWWNYLEYDGAGAWMLDIADAQGNPIACNIPLITGADCLDGLAYLGINGSLWVLTSGSSPFDVPTYSNLGTDSNLYFQTAVAS